MEVHRLGVDDRQDDSGADSAVRADRAEDMNRAMPIVAHHRRTRADRCPDIFDRAFLPDPGFVLEPHLDRLTGRSCRQGVTAQAAEFFLKSSCATASFFG